MQATAVAALVLAGGFVVLALVGLAALVGRPGNRPADPAALPVEAEELARHANLVQTEAAWAVALAVDARHEAQVQERLRDQTWAAQEEAERAYRQALADAVAGRAALAAPAADHPEREREVSRAALSAYRRGDISVAELREVFCRAGDRDPAQDEREQVADRCRVRQAEARRAYDRAAAAARRADQAARIAEVAAQALVDEAAESAAEAEEARLRVRSSGRRPGWSQPRRG